MTFSAKFDDEPDMLTPRRYISDDIDDANASFDQRWPPCVIYLLGG